MFLVYFSVMDYMHTNTILFVCPYDNTKVILNEDHLDFVLAQHH